MPIENGRSAYLIFPMSIPSLSDGGGYLARRSLPAGWPHATDIGDVQWIRTSRSVVLLMLAAAVFNGLLTRARWCTRQRERVPHAVHDRRSSRGPLPEDLGEAELEARLFIGPSIPSSATRPLPEWAALREELKRKGVTLQLLWLEYKTQHPDGYQYTQFCEHYRTWAATLEPALRQVHVAGERVFVDYAGPTMPVFDRSSDEERAAQVFVSALGASHLLYAEATWTQTLPDWIGAHVRMLDYYGGVPALIVPDNASALVRHPVHADCRADRHPKNLARLRARTECVSAGLHGPLHATPAAPGRGTRPHRRRRVLRQTPAAAREDGFTYP